MSACLLAAGAAGHASAAVPSNDPEPFVPSAAAVDDFSPPPEVSVSNGLVAVKYVPQTISGDVNCDGKVTPSDVIQALGYSLGSARRFAGATAISTATG